VELSREAILAVISGGQGTTIATASAMGIAYEGLTYREIHTPAGVSGIDQSIYWRSSNQNPALLAFLGILGPETLPE
jgi:hypothetical protein